MKFADEIEPPRLFAREPKFRDEAEPSMADYKPMTLAWIIERFIAAMDGTSGEPAVKVLGESHRLTLRVIARMPIGAKLASALTKHDVIGMGKQLLARKLKPATCGQYVNYLSIVVKYAPAAWDDCADIKHEQVKLAITFLGKNSMIGKSEPRHQRPTPEQIATLEALAAKANQHPNNKIDMVRFVRWQLASSRRLAESCRIVWTDWAPDDQTIWVHKMKDPRNRDKSKQVALTDEAQDMLLEMAWEMNDRPETWANQERRIFPYAHKSVGQKFTKLKHRAEIHGAIHLHDFRAECYTRLKEKGIPASAAILVTGHESEVLPERVYNRIKAASFKALQKQALEQRAA